MSFGLSRDFGPIQQSGFRAAKDKNVENCRNFFVGVASEFANNCPNVGAMVLHCESQAIGWPTISGRKSAIVELRYRRRLIVAAV